MLGEFLALPTATAGPTYSGGSHWLVRVEVSVDGGSETSWQELSQKYFHAWYGVCCSDRVC